MRGSTGTHARGLDAPARVEGRPGKLAESDSDEFDDVSLSEECLPWEELQANFNICVNTHVEKLNTPALLGKSSKGCIFR